MLPLTELDHGRQGQTEKGGVKWVSNPHFRVKDKVVCLSDAECSNLPRGTYTDCRGVELYPWKNQTDMTASAQGCASLKEWGVCELHSP